MAQEAFSATEAEAALKRALTENDDLIDKFNETNQKVAAAFTNAGDAVKGRLGEAAANCWGDGSGDFFSKNLSVKTEDFLARRVKEILETMNAFTTSTENAYSSTTSSNGTTTL